MGWGKLYVVLSNSNGEKHTDVMDREELHKRLTPGPQGDRYYGGDRYEIVFANSMEEFKVFNRTNQEMAICLLILEGEIVIPKPVKIATSYDF